VIVCNPSEVEVILWRALPPLLQRRIASGVRSVWLSVRPLVWRLSTDPADLSLNVAGRVMLPADPIELLRASGLFDGEITLSETGGRIRISVGSQDRLRIAGAGAETALHAALVLIEEELRASPLPDLSELVCPDCATPRALALSPPLRPLCPFCQSAEPPRALRELLSGAPLPPSDLPDRDARLRELLSRAALVEE